MVSRILGAARPWAARRMLLFAALALPAGCATFERSPLVAGEFQRVLEARRPDAAEVTGAIGQPAYAPADGLSLPEAELLALYLNPRLRAARKAAGIPAASARFAGLWEDPEIGADALRILEGVEEPWIAGASLSFSIPISGRLAVAKAQARAEARAALVEAWTGEANVLRELREAWTDHSAASRSLAISRDLHRRLRDLVNLTNQREEMGELIAAEAVAFRLAEARLQLDLAQLEAAEEQGRLRVLGILGLLPGTELNFTQSEIDPHPIETDLADAVYERSPGVLLAASRYEAAEERLRLEVRKQYPDIALGPLYGNEEGMHRLGIGFSVPIPILNANRQAIAEAHAARDAARADWEQAVHENLSALAQGVARLAAAESRLDTLMNSIVPLANQQIEQARHLADLGEINTLLILEALQAEREAALDQIEAEAAVANARAAIRAIVPEHAPRFDAMEENR